MSILKKIVQYWEDGDTGYTVTTTYDAAGVGTIVDSRGDAAVANLHSRFSDAEIYDVVYDAAVGAIQASVARGDITQTQGLEAIGRLNIERLSPIVTSGGMVQPLSPPGPEFIGAAGRVQSDGVHFAGPGVSEASAKAVSNLQDKGVLGKEPVKPATTVGTIIAPSNHPKSGPLPANFPLLDKLHAAKINTYFQLTAFADDYTKIAGVGPAGAKLITEAVK